MEKKAAEKLEKRKSDCKSKGKVLRKVLVKNKKGESKRVLRCLAPLKGRKPKMSDKEKRQRKKADCLKKGKEWRYNAKTGKTRCVESAAVRKAKAKAAAAKRKAKKVTTNKPQIRRSARLQAINSGSSNITMLELPQKGSPSEFDVKEWTEFYLTDEWVKKATKDGIPYPKEFFIITHIYKNKNGKPISVRFRGSMGGGYDKIPWNTPNLIKSKA